MDGKPTGKFYRLPLAGFRWGLKRRGKGRGNVDALAKARAARGAGVVV
jgi:hypothetical protein